MSPSLQPYWNAEGVCHYLESYPESFDAWNDGESLSPSYAAAFARAKELLGKSIVSSRILADSVNITAEITLSSGDVFILRWLPSATLVSEWARRKMEAEVGIMALLQQHKSSIPSPEVIAKSFSDDCLCFIMEKLPGAMAFNCFGSLTPSSKEQAIISYANIVLTLFRITIPDDDKMRIGTLINDSSGVRITPRIYIDNRCPESVHQTAEEYLESLIDLTMNNYLPLIQKGEENLARAREMHQRLKKHLVSAWRDLPAEPRLRRLALRHDDLRPSNILLDPTSGVVTGVIDWEYHSVQPAVLVAEYPSWLQCTGPEDPKFASPNNWWFCSQEECSHYRQLFEQVVREKDADFHECLKVGKTVRDGISWLKWEDSDPGCESLGKWMDATFGQETQ